MTTVVIMKNRYLGPIVLIADTTGTFFILYTCVGSDIISLTTVNFNKNLTHKVRALRVGALTYLTLF